MQASKTVGISRTEVEAAADSTVVPRAPQVEPSRVSSKKLILSLSIALLLFAGASAFTAARLRNRVSSSMEACQAPAGMLDRLWCWFKGVPREKPTPPKTHLTSEQAIALAQAAMGDVQRPMALATFVQREGRGVWHVTSRIAMGAMPYVDVDDATGEILAKGRRGIR